MAARTPEAEKRPGFFKQIRSLFTFTREVYPWLGWLLLGILIVGLGLGVLVGFLLQPAVWGVILWGLAGLMFGLLAAMMTLTRLSTNAMYRKNSVGAEHRRPQAMSQHLGPFFCGGRDRPGLPARRPLP